MDLKLFAEQIKALADERFVTLLPISKVDAANGCLVRFRMGNLSKRLKQ